jgi:hypothetical protein
MPGILVCQLPELGRRTAGGALPFSEPDGVPAPFWVMCALAWVLGFGHSAPGIGRLIAITAPPAMARGPAGIELAEVPPVQRYLDRVVGDPVRRLRHQFGVSATLTCWRATYSIPRAPSTGGHGASAPAKS